MLRPAVLAAALGAALAGALHAAEYPERPVRFILPNAAGGSPDTISRILAVRLTDILGQQFVIDNRPGAGGIIAVEAVAKATPDGYTLLQCGISQTISPALKRKLPYDTWLDFARIVQYGGVPNILAVHAGLPVLSLADLVAHARANPGKLKYGSSGFGFTPHLTMEALSTPDMRKRFGEHGVELRTTAGREFDAFYKSEVARWSRVVQEAGIKPD